MNTQQIDSSSYLWKFWLQQQKKSIYLVSVSFKEEGLRGKLGAVCWWVTIPLIIWWFIPTGHSFWLKWWIYNFVSGIREWGCHPSFYKYSAEYHTGINMIISWWTGITKGVKQ